MELSLGSKLAAQIGCASRAPLDALKIKARSLENSHCLGQWQCVHDRSFPLRSVEGQYSAVIQSVRRQFDQPARGLFRQVDKHVERDDGVLASLVRSQPFASVGRGKFVVNSLRQGGHHVFAQIHAGQGSLKVCVPQCHPGQSGATTDVKNPRLWRKRQNFLDNDRR